VPAPESDRAHNALQRLLEVIEEQKRREGRRATAAEIEEARLAHASAVEDFHGSRLLPDYDPATDHRSEPPDWVDLYAELIAEPALETDAAIHETSRARGVAPREYPATAVARAVLLWLNAKGKPNQSEIARKSGLSRRAVARIGRLYEAKRLWVDSDGRLLLGNGSDFRAAEETVSLRALEQELDL
jgi:hypothetical protein